jgi:hypothetical protein
LFNVVSYTTRPAAGLVMAFFCVVVILGGRNPFVVLDTSNKADAFGVAVPIAIVPLFSMLKISVPLVFLNIAA